jgi:Family of unknown function (DUF5906)
MSDTEQNIVRLSQKQSRPVATEDRAEAITEKAANDERKSRPNIEAATPSQAQTSAKKTPDVANPDGPSSTKIATEKPHRIVRFLPIFLGRAVQQEADDQTRRQHIRDVATDLFSYGISRTGVRILARQAPFGRGAPTGECDQIIKEAWTKWKERGMPLARGSAAAYLRELLKTHAIVYVGGKALICRWRDDPARPDCRVLDLITWSGFRLYHSNRGIPEPRGSGDVEVQPVAEEFMELARRYNGLVFAPGKGPAVNGCLNLWQGFAVKPAPGEWPLMRRHIEEVLANGDKKVADYILKWSAWSVKHPGEQAEVALAFIGGRGTGKGVFGRAMVQIFGTHGLHIAHSKHLVGAFNRHFLHCALLFVDEAFWAGDKQGEGALKALITEPTLTIEPKGVDLFTVRNCLHVIMASNEDWIVPAGADERRFAAFRVSDARRGDKAYFDALNAELENGGLAAMLHDLLAMDLGDWHPRQNVPQTRALLDQKIESLRGIDRVIADIAHEGSVPCAMLGHPDIAVTSGEREGDGFWAYCKQAAPELRHAGPKTMMPKLRAWGCKRIKSGSRAIQFPPLGELRAKFDEKYGPQEWDDATDWIP